MRLSISALPDTTVTNTSRHKHTTALRIYNLFVADGVTKLDSVRSCYFQPAGRCHLNPSESPLQILCPRPRSVQTLLELFRLVPVPSEGARVGSPFTHGFSGLTAADFSENRGHPSRNRKVRAEQRFNLVAQSSTLGTASELL